MELYEISPLPSYRLKTRSPLLYWIRILFFSYVVVHLSLVLVDDVEADTPAHDEQEIQSDSEYTNGPKQSQAADFVRQMNGTLWVFNVWENETDATERILFGHFSTDNGSTWSQIVVTDDEDPGYDTDGYPKALFNTVVLSNNSIIICLQDMDYWGTTGKYEITFLCHWNNSDLGQWERVQGYYLSTRYALFGNCNVNETDKIVFSYQAYSLTHVYIRSFDPSTRNVDIEGTIANKYPVGIYETTYVFWNGTDWNILVRYLTNVFCYDIDGDLGFAWSFGLGADREITDIVLSANGTYGIAINRQQVASYYWYAEIWFRNATGDVIFRTIDTGQWGSGRLGLSNYNDDYFTYIAYEYIEDEFAWWGAEYWRGAAHWGTSKTSCFEEDYDSPNTAHFDWPVEMPNAVYPVDPATGNHTQLPATLGGPTWCFMEYDSSTTSNDLWVDYETTWAGILGWTYTLSVPDPEPEVVETTGILWWDGEMCGAWAIGFFIIMVAIGLIGVFGRNL